MPPTPVRRPLTITLWLVMSSLCLVLSPLILATGALASALLRRPQPMVMARLMIGYFARELAVLVACGGLWLASGLGWRLRSRPLRRAHYRLLHWFCGGMTARIRELLDITVAPAPTPDAERALQRSRPLLFFSRHAGPGDTVLITDLLMTRYDRLPSLVFKEALTIDPCIDLLGHRLPHAVLDTADPADCEARITEASAELSPRGVLVLFPEGGNLTAQRREASIAKLWRKGRRRDAAAGERMEHVMPPHPAGALAALRGNPQADVIFSAHTGLGLGAFPGQLWRWIPLHSTLSTRMWLVPAADRPATADPDAQVRWLYDWWARIDAWVAEQGEELPETVPG